MYNVEIFKPTGEIASAFNIDEKDVEIVDDYISPKEFTILAPVDADIGTDYICQITDTKNRKYVEVVTSYEETKYYKIISVISPLVYFNQDMFMYGRTDAPLLVYVSHCIEDNLIGGLMGYYPVTIDKTVKSMWNVGTTLWKSKVFNGLEALRIIAKSKHGFIEYNQLDANHKIVFSFRVGYPYVNSKRLEIFLDNIIDKNIAKGSNVAPNIARLWVPSSVQSASCRSYGATIVNGVIVQDENAVKSVENPVTISRVFASSPSATARTTAFNEMLMVENDDIQISIKVDIDDSIWSDIAIGDRCILTDKDAIYTAYCTGYKVKGRIKEFIFGMARTTLTDKLTINDKAITNG